MKEAPEVKLSKGSELVPFLRENARPSASFGKLHLWRFLRKAKHTWHIRATRSFDPEVDCARRSPSVFPKEAPEVKLVPFLRKAPEVKLPEGSRQR